MKKFLYVEAVILLMLLCFWRTAVFLDIKPPEVFSQSESKNAGDADDKYEVHVDRQNYFQHYDGMTEYGFFAHDNKSIYHVRREGDNWSLIKTERKSGESSILLSGGRIKNVVLTENRVYATVSIVDDSGILKDYIAYVPANGGDRKVLYQSEADFITSMFAYGDNLYYTNSSSNAVYQMDIKKEEFGTFFENDNPKGESPVIFDIRDGWLYYSDGTGYYSMSINSKEKNVLTTTYTSIRQHPVFDGNEIVLFSDLTNDVIIGYDKDSGNTRSITEKGEFSEIQNFILYNDVLFVMSENQIFYKKNGEEPQLLKEAEPGSEVFFILDDMLYYEDGVHGTLGSVPITYIVV